MAEKKKEIIRSLKFLFFSISAGIIQIVSFTLLNEVLHLIYWLGYLIALVLSVLWNFTLNRKFTFHSAGNVPKAMLLVGCYYLVFTHLSTWWTAPLTGEAVGLNEYLVLAMTMIINFVTEYLFDRLVVFKDTIDTEK